MPVSNNSEEGAFHLPDSPDTNDSIFLLSYREVKAFLFDNSKNLYDGIGEMSNFMTRSPHETEGNMIVIPSPYHFSDPEAEPADRISKKIYPAFWLDIGVWLETNPELVMPMLK